VRFLPREAEPRTAKFDDAVSNAVTSRDSGSTTGRGRAVSRCKMVAALRSTGDSADKMASMSRDSTSRATAPTERSRNSAQFASIADNLSSPIERLLYACGHTLTPNKNSELEAREVLPNTNRTRAAERAEECRFCPW